MDVLRNLTAGFLVVGLSLNLTGGAFAQDVANGAKDESALPAVEVYEEEITLPPDQAAPLLKETERLIKEEIDAIGSFEVDDPETGELIGLSYTGLKEDAGVVQVFPGEYMVHANFKDSKGTDYGVDVYLETFEDNEYEIVDAIVVDVNGKSVFEEELMES